MKIHFTKDLEACSLNRTFYKGRELYVGIYKNYKGLGIKIFNGIDRFTTELRWFVFRKTPIGWKFFGHIQK